MGHCSSLHILRYEFIMALCFHTLYLCSMFSIFQAAFPWERFHISTYPLHSPCAITDDVTRINFVKFLLKLKATSECVC